VVSLVNGRQVGEDHLELSGLCQVMLTSWRTLKDIYKDINTSATIILSVEILGPITRSRAQ
jgi:hypothetical protein